MKLFPKASLDDGLLDLLLIPRKSKLDILRLFPKVYSGEITNIDGVVYLQAASLKIVTAQPINIEDVYKRQYRYFHIDKGKKI